MRVMRTRSVLAGAVFACFLLAACGSTHAVNTLGTTSTTGAKGAAAPGSAKTAAGSSSTATTTSTAKAGTEGAVGTAKIEVAKTALGQVLADAKGRTLYLYKQDTQGKASTCDGSCAVTWPPGGGEGQAHRRHRDRRRQAHHGQAGRRHRTGGL